MRAKAFLRTVCAFTTLAPLASAQQFLEPTHRFLPPDVERDSVAAAGDLDGDGDQDLVLASGTRVQGLANDGTGRFAWRLEMGVGTGRITSLLLVDYDGDGDLDVFAGHTDAYPSQPQSNEVLENLGGFRFRSATTVVLPPGRPTTWAIVAVDVDRDGDPDLIVSNGAGDWLLLNQGGRFADATTSHLPNAAGSSDVAVGDVDGDGDSDLFFAGGPDRLHLNDGTGRFVLAAAGSIPSGPSRAGWLVDLDGDGAVDLLRQDWSELSVAWNNGGQLGSATPLGAVLDPLVGNLRGSVIFYRDLGTGELGLLKFDRSRGRQQHLVLPEPVAPSLLLDIDGDGDGDLLAFGFGDRAFLYTNDLGSFTRAGGHPLRNDWLPGVLAAADLNGDGFDDLVERHRLLFNDGTGVFEGSEFVYPRTLARHAGELVAGDVDGDGDMDMVHVVERSSGSGSRWSLALNDGNAGFSTLFLDNLYAQRAAVWSAQLADLNGDGRNDLVWCSLSGIEYAAGPLPTATPRIVYSLRGAASRILLADVDADGDLDLVASIERNGVRLLLNDGAARFTDVSGPRLPVGSSVLGADAIASGDVDGDGDLDLFIGGLPSQPDVLYVNDGTGTFADRSAQLPPRPAGSGEGVLFDIDGDGDLDIATRSGEVLRNDGRGVFTLDPEILDASWGFTIATLDADRDGDRDLVLGNKVFVNLHRQLVSPYAPRVGRDFPLEIHARSTGGAGGFAALLLSATRQSPPIPVPGLGLLGLHPWFMVNAGGYPIAPGSTRADVSFAVPSLPGLVGIDLHGQALVWSGTRLDLTNVVTSTVCY